MSEDQNTPPHAKLEIIVTDHIPGLIANCSVHIKGCTFCLAEAIAAHLVASPPLKELINKAVRIANERKAQKDN